MMYRSIVLLFLCCSLVSAAWAQEIPAAKTAYEAAREAFKSKKFEIALEKLQESERFEGAITAKILSLRVQALDSLLRSPGYRGPYSFLELKQASTLYLQRYGRGEGDQFSRSVCRILRRLYPIADEKLVLAHTANAEAIMAVGHEYYFFGNTKVGMEWLRTAADLQYTPAMLELGAILEMEFGNHFETALAWYLKAEALGDIRAPFNIGVLYYHALPDKERQDYTKAEAWFLKGAARSDYLATGRLGDLYLNGAGSILQDIPKAIRYYETAFSLGSAHSARQLADMHFKGERVVREYSLALQWYKKAALLGDVQAMHQLVKMYQEGIGTVKDAAMARAWQKKIDVLKEKEEETENSPCPTARPRP